MYRPAGEVLLKDIHFPLMSLFHQRDLYDIEA